MNDAKLELQKLDERFKNLKKIQNVFLDCHFNSTSTRKMFKEIISDQNVDFSRYNYFYALYLASTGKIKNAREVIDLALESYQEI